jgi:hypothetical protein
MKKVLSLLLFLSIFQLAIFCQAEEPLVLYDDFQSQFIDPEKWVGYEASNGNILRESGRLIQRKKLNIFCLGYPDPSVVDESLYGIFALGFANPDKIKTIKAKVKVANLNKAVMDCDAAAGAMARIRGYFFNTDTPIMGSYINDVAAGIRIGPSTVQPGKLEVLARVVHCLDANCDNALQIYRKTLRTVSLNEEIELGIEWDPDNDRFIFHYGKDFDVCSYNGILNSDEQLASMSFVKRLDTTVLLPNCTSASAAKSYIDVYYDDVYLNQSALDP